MEQIQNAIQVKDDEKIIRQSSDLVGQANALVITSAMDFCQAVELEKTLKAFLEGPGTYHDEEIEMAHNLHKKLCEKRNAIIAPVQKAWKLLKDRRAQWQWQEQERQKEEQRKAEAEARRLEEEKQAKIQAKIDEENRKIREAQEEEERIQRAKEAELKKIKDKEAREQAEREERTRRELEEKRLEAERIKSEEKKFALEEKKESVYVAPRAVAPRAVAPSGVTVQFDYEPRIINKRLVPQEYLIVDVAMLKRMQKAAKGTLTVPGVDFIKVPVGRTGKVAAA